MPRPGRPRLYDPEPPICVSGLYELRRTRTASTSAYERWSRPCRIYLRSSAASQMRGNASCMSDSISAGEYSRRHLYIFYVYTSVKDPYIRKVQMSWRTTTGTSRSMMRCESNDCFYMSRSGADSASVPNVSELSSCVDGVDVMPHRLDALDAAA